jgi:hypothetical protein
MSSRDETMPPADAGQLVRGVGRPAPEREDLEPWESLFAARLSPVVTREECSDAVWALLESYSAQINRLREELVGAYKRLCPIEGHAPIGDHTGAVWCELCEERIDNREPPNARLSGAPR